jgi:chemotaxis methyl-accepting protein methylase
MSDTGRVEFMLKTAKTKAELQELVRMLDNRNLQLQNVIRRMTTPETETTRKAHGHV